MVLKRSLHDIIMKMHNPPKMRSKPRYTVIEKLEEGLVFFLLVPNASNENDDDEQTHAATDNSLLRPRGRARCGRVRELGPGVQWCAREDRGRRERERQSFGGSCPPTWRVGWYQWSAEG